MTFMTEAELESREPQFLWTSPLSYRITRSPKCVRFVFGRLSRKARRSLMGLIAVLGLAGVVELSFGWPLYAAILPVVVTGAGVMSQAIARRRRFKNCELELM